MAANLGNSTLRRRARRGDPMRDFDHLPVELQEWLASAVLPWRPKSVHRVYERVLAKERDRVAALDRLDQIERRLIAKDALRIWGADHPYLAPVEGARSGCAQTIPSPRSSSFVRTSPAPKASLRISTAFHGSASPHMKTSNAP